jgi:Abortive infection alpha
MPNEKQTKRGHVQLTAEAKLAATYAVRKNIKEVIPSDVTRAKVASWLDLISPLTERAGLKGDQLRLKRDILRLHREETLSRIASSIRAKGPINLGKSKVPNKFIVNFLERASLEDPDDELVEFWSNLLISAAEDYNPYHIHFINIISQLSSKQAKLVESIIGTKILSELEIAQDIIETDLTESRIREYLARNVKKVIRVPEIADLALPSTIQKLGDVCGEWFNVIGVEFVYGDV